MSLLKLAYARKTFDRYPELSRGHATPGCSRIRRIASWVYVGRAGIETGKLVEPFGGWSLDCDLKF